MPTTQHELSATKRNAVYLKEYAPPHFFIDEIDLCFELEETVTIVTSNMRIRHNRYYGEHSHDLILDGEELTLISVKLNGVPLTAAQYELTAEHLLLRNIPDKCELQIITHIYPEKNTALSGLYRSRGTYCTQCEAQGFRRITYFLDRPDVLARFSTTIIAAQKQYPYLLSNGNLVSERTLADGRWVVTFLDPFKKPAYLFALVAGDFDVLTDTFETATKQKVALKIYVEKGYGDQTQHALYSLKEAMQWDERAFGREYDLDVYMIVAIHDFNMGAMENKGLNIFNTKYILAKKETATDEDYMHIMSVIGHEYFHNWTGNRITCRDWFQLSLKEGLTIFRDQSFSQERLSPSVMRIKDVIALRESQFPEDAGPLAHPVRPESYIEINNFYTATIYNKGAEVIRMIQTILGKSLFRKGMDLYFARHDGQAVTIEDFVVAMEDVSGVDFAQFRLWYTQIGTPTVAVSETYDAATSTYTLHLEQSIKKTTLLQDENSPLHIPLRIGLLQANGSPFALQLAHEQSASLKTTQDSALVNEMVLHLKKAQDSFVFKNITAKPIASVGRDFSAPIKLLTMHKEADWLFLLKFDEDAFNRFEACQQLMMEIILNLIAANLRHETLTFPKSLQEALQFLLENAKDDPFLIAEMLRLPSERYISEQLAVVDVVAIHLVREFLLREIAQQLEIPLLKTYHYYQENTSFSEFSSQNIGKRKLKNTCLFYLMHLTKYIGLGMQQFEAALQTQMSDTEAVLQSLTHLDAKERLLALEQFYNTYQDDALVVDKWLHIQATSKLPGTLSAVKKLYHHAAFALNNPNKVYALIGGFAFQNAINFHQEDGAAYVFLREVVEELDRLNPQIAARMVKPLTNWRRYDEVRQLLMQQQLQLLLETEGISNDLYELVAKSLA